MASYKVIQDIEAEDKLLGPLTFHQFVYALICAALLFLTWFVGKTVLVMAPVFFLPAVVAGFFAYPWRRDQPTELWALAKIRFMMKPHKRIWNQSGAKELVTVTAPKKTKARTSNLSQGEVKSRLHALADTLDSRGWAVKGPATSFTQPAFAGGLPSDSDRLVHAEVQQQAEEVTPAEDMFDEQNNPRAQRMNSLIQQSTKARRDKVIQQLSQPEPKPPQQKPQDYWFMNQPGGATNVSSDQVTFSTQVVSPVASGATPPIAPTAIPGQPAAAQPAAPIDEDQLAKELDARKQESPIKSYYGHLRTILPVAEQKQAEEEARTKAIEAARAAAAEAAKKQQTKPPAPSPERQAALQQLASNNDLNVATIAREAKRSSDDEVVVQLH